MIEMHSAEESKMFFMAFVLYVLISVSLTVILNYFINKRKDKHRHRHHQADEMTVHVSDDEYYQIAEKALEHQKMLEFKCEMNGIDKTIRVLKGEDE